LPFVSFPGNEIKDLFVHEEVPEELPPPPVKSNLPHSSENKSQNKFPPRPDQHQVKQKPLPKPRNYTTTPASSAPTTSAGTGEHLLKLKERTTTGSSAMENPVGEFDFETGLTSFKKDVVLAEVAEEANSNGVLAGRYIKDNFFDTLSSSVDPDIARKDRMTAGEERVLNQDTFGAIALQQNYRRGGRGGNGRGNGRGGYNYRGRGNGRGGYHNHNNNYRGDNNNGNNNYRGGDNNNGNTNNHSNNNSNHNSNYRGENRRGRGTGNANRQAANKAVPEER
jgi:protein LSM14